MAKNKDGESLKPTDTTTNQPVLRPSDQKNQIVTEPQEEQEQDQKDHPEKMQHGYETPDDSPIHNVSKVIIPALDGDPDPGNPVLSNPSLMSQVPLVAEGTLEQNAKDEQDAITSFAPSVNIGDHVKYITGNNIDRHATVTNVDPDSNVTLHVMFNPEDTEYAKHGALAVLQNVFYSAERTAHHWFK